jgi:hypothetical protein
MTDHDAIRTTGDLEMIVCRCGETFATSGAHEAHWALERARLDAPAGLAAARKALKGDRGSVEWGGSELEDRFILRCLVGVILSLLVLLAFSGPEPSAETSPDPMTYQEDQP